MPMGVRSGSRGKRRDAHRFSCFGERSLGERARRGSPFLARCVACCEADGFFFAGDDFVSAAAFVLGAGLEDGFGAMRVTVRRG